MTRLRLVLNFCLTLFLCLALLERPAHAYVDPGTGSMLMQLLLGGAAGLAIIFKLYWRRIKAIFGRVETDPDARPEVDSPEDHPSLQK